MRDVVATARRHRAGRRGIPGHGKHCLCTLQQHVRPIWLMLLADFACCRNHQHSLKHRLGRKAHKHRPEWPSKVCTASSCTGSSAPPSPPSSPPSSLMSSSSPAGPAAQGALIILAFKQLTCERMLTCERIIETHRLKTTDSKPAGAVDAQPLRINGHGAGALGPRLRPMHCFIRSNGEAHSGVHRDAHLQDHPALCGRRRLQ